MDVVNWNQHPDDVNDDLPYSRRHSPNLSDQLFGRAVQEAREVGGVVDSLEAGNVWLRAHGSVLTDS